ncbi:MAG: hypothetical protein RLZZ360_167 [Candidatus Parcubacteria bacterium]|jgi:hypothetical protein
MTNLIPPSAEKLVIKEYWLRVVAVWLFLFGTGCLIVASLHLPTYVLVRNELTDLRQQVANNAAETASIDTSSAAIQVAMTDATLLLTMGTSSGQHVATIEALTTIAGSDVALSSFSLTVNEKSTQITITGTARTRTALANFRDAIEADDRFTDAILPISSLIKDRNIDFTMTVTSNNL